MRKDEVYSWRLASSTKQALEDEARRSNKSLARLLAEVVERWLSERRQSLVEEDEQQALWRKEAETYIGTLRGNDPSRAERARELVRERLTRRHASKPQRAR